MMRFFKVVIVSFLMILASSVEANAQSSKFNWGPVMDAIIQLESKGNALAVNGSYVGVLQISPILVKECNNILKSRGSSKRYTLSDRFNATKSKEMFVIEKAIRLWSGGIKYDVAKTQKYLTRVLKLMR